MSFSIEALRLALLWEPKLSFYGYLAATTDHRLSLGEHLACITYDKTTQRCVVSFDPERMGELSILQQKWVYIHELLHWLSQHFLRMAGRNLRKWNIATDFAINDMIARELAPFNIVAPPQGILLMNKEMKDAIPEADRFAEKIYDWLPDDNDELDKLLESVAGNGEPTNHQSWSELQDIPTDLIKAQIADAIETSSRAAGNIPGHIKVILDTLLDPKINWRTVLRHVIGSGRPNGQRRSWARLDRRFDNELPGKKKIRRGHLLVVLDRSASVRPDELNQFRTEVEYQFKIHDVTIIVCDTQVTDVIKYRRRMLLEVGGGGGTDLNPGLEEADKLDGGPIVIFTDGGLFREPIQTNKEQIWVITPNGSDGLLKDRTVIRMEM